MTNRTVWAALLLTAAAAPATAAPVLADGTFDVPTVGYGMYAYPGSVLGGWNYGGAALVDGETSSAWYGASAPAGRDGNQFVALQSNSSISQSFVATAKTMSLSWINAGRPNMGPGGNETYAITLDGVAVSGTRSTSTGQAFVGQSKVIGGLIPLHTYTLGFQGLVTGSDQTAFIDKVALIAAPLRTNQIDNGGFEAPNLGAGNYAYYGGLKDGWTYGGSALVNAQGSSPWYGTSAPAGQEAAQFAALQGGSSLSQTFTAYNGNLKLSWLAGGRPSFGTYAGDQTYTVALDGKVLGTYGVLSGQAFGDNTVEVDHLTHGSHTLTFQGLSPRDQTAFIDDVAATAIPEPAVWLLMVGGFGLIGAAARRRTGVVAA